jgi:hypothetical protein
VRQQHSWSFLPGLATGCMEQSPLVQGGAEGAGNVAYVMHGPRFAP